MNLESEIVGFRDLYDRAVSMDVPKTSVEGTIDEIELDVPKPRVLLVLAESPSPAKPGNPEPFQEFIVEETLYDSFSDFAEHLEEVATNKITEQTALREGIPEDETGNFGKVVEEAMEEGEVVDRPFDPHLRVGITEDLYERVRPLTTDIFNGMYNRGYLGTDRYVGGSRSPVSDWHGESLFIRQQTAEAMEL